VSLNRRPIVICRLIAVKGVNFFGPKSEYVISGSDCGNIFIWDKNTEAVVQWMAGDNQGVVSFSTS